MPATELSAYGGPEREPNGYAGPATAAALSAVGLIVAVWPLSAVLQPGAWSAGAVVVPGSVILTALVVRLLARRGPAWVALPAVPLAQLIVGTLTLSVFASKQIGSGLLLPVPDALGRIGPLLSTAAEEVRAGAAPLAGTPALAVSVAVVTGMLAVVLDLVLVALRAGLVAAVLLTVAGAVPAIAVHGGLNPVWFLALAVAIVLFLHVRFAPPGSGPRRGAERAPVPLVRTRTATTLAVGAVAVVTALVVSPLLPLSASGISAGGGTTTLSATLDLGQDLRRPSPVTALTLIDDDGTAPYLRIATLSTFDGSRWQPDHPATVPLTQGLGAVTASGGVATHRSHATIRTTGIAGAWLPVPYQATAVSGAGGSWVAAPDNRTVRRRERRRRRPELHGRHDRGGADARADPRLDGLRIRCSRRAARPPEGHAAGDRRGRRVGGGRIRHRLRQAHRAADLVPGRVPVFAEDPRRRRLRRHQRAGGRDGSSACARGTACTSPARSRSWRAPSACRPGSWSAICPARRPIVARTTARSCSTSAPTSCTPGPRSTSPGSAGCRSSRPRPAACRPGSSTRPAPGRDPVRPRPRARRRSPRRHRARRIRTVPTSRTPGRPGPPRHA